MSIGIDEGLLDMLNEYCDNNFINRSKLMEGLIDEFLAKKNAVI